MVAIRHLSARIALERRHAVPAVDSSESLLLVPYFLFRAPAVAADMTVVAVCKCLVLIFVTCFVPLKRKSYSGTGLHDCGAGTKEGCLLICLSLPRASCLPPLENGDWLRFGQHRLLLSTVLQSASSDLRTSGQTSLRGIYGVGKLELAGCIGRGGIQCDGVGDSEWRFPSSTLDCPTRYGKDGHGSSELWRRPLLVLCKSRAGGRMPSAAAALPLLPFSHHELYLYILHLERSKNH
jgi:hypothetical protein